VIDISDVRVLASPGRRFIAIIEVVDRAHLQPAEEAVDVGRAGTVAPATFNDLHLTEPSEEEEEVADADALILKVSLHSLRLPEAGPPAGRPRAGGGIEIRIKVRARRHAARIAGKLRRDVAKAASVVPDVLQPKVIV
jgi:hypothetical protein